MRVCLLIVFAALSATPASSQSLRNAAQWDFTVTDLGVPEGSFSQATAINNRGDIVGFAESGDGRTVTAFVWTQKNGFNPAVDGGRAWDINDRGQVVGTLFGDCGAWAQCVVGGFLWSERGGLRTLGDFYPWAVNNRGDMVGTCGSEWSATAAFEPCALIGGMMYRISPDNRTGIARDIDDRGNVVGFVYGDPDEEGGRTPVAFTWSLKQGFNLPVGFTGSSANALGARGDFAGGVELTAAVWRQRDAHPRQLQTDAWWSEVAGMNRRGWMVGHIAFEGAFQPMLWTLEDRVVMLPLGDGFGGGAGAVNERGTIVGYVNAETTGRRAVMWQPRRSAPHKAKD